jgi:hypothetical protein
MYEHLRWGKICMDDETFGLPIELGDGLVLRWATPEDVDELAAFNVRVHSDNPEEPETFLEYWTRDLMRGDHPTTKASDFTLVVDTNDGDKIVSTMNLISQTWLYEDIPFKVGRPELVATDEDYRRRGLVRKQFDVIHNKSAARGEMALAITGVPWYYRMFDYEMALDLGGARNFDWKMRGNHQPVDPEIYRMRPAEKADMPVLKTLYAEYGRNSLITRQRDDLLWHYEIDGPHKESPYARHFLMIESIAEDEVVGYMDYKHWGNRFVVRELGVLPGKSWRPICLFVTRYLKAEADKLKEAGGKSADYVSFDLGADHPVYDALGRQLGKQFKPYAWYMRVPDLHGFVRHIAPVLERRLANSVLVGHSGELKLNFFISEMKLVFEAGKLVDVGNFERKLIQDGDASFPDLTFLQLLFGRRSFDELDDMFPDCYVNSAETAVLLNILFPKKHSRVVGLG